MTSKSRSRVVAALAGATALVLACLQLESPTSDAPEPSAEAETDRRDRTSQRRSTAGPSDAQPRGAAQATDETSWWPGEVMVMLGPDVDAAELAHDLGVELAREARYAPLAVFRTAPGADTVALQAELADDPRVQGQARHGRMTGAHKGGGSAKKGGKDGGDPTVGLAAYQLQHRGITKTTDATLDVSSVVVAVLDTGVAYEDRGPFVQAPSLASNAIVSPYDAVDGDLQANDGHQHGTHIASIIGSSGAVEGIAPGVALMPVRVLGDDNTGSEIDLIDGILHAIDHGADILNMSLAFGPGYVPSAALIDALQEARDAGVLPIAAGGNDAVTGLAFPAASPLVVGVNPTYRYKQSKRGVYWTQSPYRNASTAADLVLPGGLLSGGDEDRDGVPDGILAETFAQGQPEAMGYWMMAGSSQAAAVASGAAAWLVAAGVSADCIAPAIAESAGSSYANAVATGYQRTHETPSLDVAIAKGLACTDQGGPDRDMYAVLSPFLVADGDVVVPTVRVALYDGSGAPVSVSSVTVHADLTTADGPEMVDCYDQTGAGVCVLEGAPLSRYAADGSEAPVAFTVSIGRVRIGNQLSQPALALYSTPALDAAVAALDADPARAGTVLGFFNDAGTEPDLGEVVEGYTVFNSGTGISTSPFGFFANRSAWQDIASVTDGTLPLGGSVDDPLGQTDTLDLREVSLDGTGISTSPFGFLPRWTGLTEDLSGSGISTSPFGLWSPSFGATAVMGGSSAGPAIQQRLADGGWTADVGPAGTALSTSGAFGDLTGATGDTSGAGAEEYTP